MSPGKPTLDPSPVVYRSLVRIEPGPDKSKLVFLPAEEDPVIMGFQGDLAPRFGLVEGSYTPRASTLDYLVGATAGCMTGVFAAGLKARSIPVDRDSLEVEATGEVETEGGILVLRRIHVVLHLRARETDRAAATRLAATYEQACPVYRSLHSTIDITSELDFRAIADQ